LLSSISEFWGNFCQHVVNALTLTCSCPADSAPFRRCPLRRRRALTLRALGDMANVNYVTVSKIERGKMPQVSVDIVVKLADALGVSVDYLLERTAQEALPTS